YKPDPKVCADIVADGMFTTPPDTTKWTFYKPRGCDKCGKTGYFGRRAIYEVFLITDEMRHIIYKTQDLLQLRESGKKNGTLNLRASAWRKVIQGQTTVDEVYSVTLSEH
ncbi:MAG: hypothetical protein GX410_07850, partial [Elusimicrobia bacterium]|nr:hypothetical protein [Elusimicrobiota bacterium]